MSTEKPTTKKENKPSTELVKTEVKTELKHSERFTQAVLREFGDNYGKIELTQFQRKLIQNYFIKIDQSLKAAKEKNALKDENYREALPFEWVNVNMEKMAIDVIAYSSIGLDPAQSNHVSFVPFKNKASNKFDIGFIIGYRGLEIKGTKYGLDSALPDRIIVQLVKQTDKFRIIKKDYNNKVENYVFEITEPFNRGKIIGGFYYKIFEKMPEKNELKEMSIEDIEKRKPDWSKFPKFP